MPAPAARPPSALLPAADLAHALNAIEAPAWRRLDSARIFLTGGSGFVGKWLIASLLAARQQFDLRCELVVLSRDPQAFATAVPSLARAPGVSLIQGDVRDFAFPAGAFSHVIHAATDVVAQHPPRLTFETCVAGTRRVLDFAAHSGAADFLLLSSGAVYGRQPPTLERLPESHAGAPDPLRPAAAYGEGKRVSEWLSALQASESSLQVKIARCFAFVGPFLPLDKHFAIGNFLRDALAGRDILIQGDGTPCRSYLHAADMAAWLWAILLNGRNGTAYNVGGDEVVTIAELAQRVIAVLGARCGVQVLQTAPAGRLPERYIPDTARARAELHLPTPISLNDAIERTARWHLDTVEVPS